MYDSASGTETLAWIRVPSGRVVTYCLATRLAGETASNQHPISCFRKSNTHELQRRAAPQGVKSPQKAAARNFVQAVVQSAAAGRRALANQTGKGACALHTRGTHSASQCFFYFRFFLFLPLSCAAAAKSGCVSDPAGTNMTSPHSPLSSCSMRTCGEHYRLDCGRFCWQRFLLDVLQKWMHIRLVAFGRSQPPVCDYFCC